MREIVPGEEIAIAYVMADARLDDTVSALDLDVHVTAFLEGHFIVK